MASKVLLAFSGFGDTPMKFYTPEGAEVAVFPGTNLSPDGGGCDGMARLDDGTVGASAINNFTPTVKSFEAFDASFTLKGGTLVSGGPIWSIASNYTSQFYVLRTPFSPDNYYIVVLDNNGAVIGSPLDLGFNDFPWAYAIGLRDQNFAYFGTRAGGFSSANSGKLFKRDFGGSSTTTIVDKSSGGYVIGDCCIIVLRNGNIVVGWKKGGGGAGLLEMYDPSGAVLRTYAMPGTGQAPVCVTPGLTDDSFWVGYYDSDVSTSSGVRIVEFDTTSGAVLHNFTPENGSFEFDGPFCAIEGLDCCEPPDNSTDPILAFVPELKDTTTYNKALEAVATIPVTSENDTAVTLAPSSGGNVWIVYDQNDGSPPGDLSIIREAHIIDATSISPSAPQVIRSIQIGGSVRLADLAGVHSFWQIGPCKFLTVNRDTHKLIEVTAGSLGGDFTHLIGLVSKEYALTKAPLDGWPNADGTRLIYVDGNALKLYDLEEDAPIRTIATFTKGIAWPVWLSDDSIIALTNFKPATTPYLNAADVVRFDFDGKILKTYTYARATQLAGGLYGLTAVFGGPVCDDGPGTIYLAGLMTDTQPGIMAIDLLSGTVSDPVATAIPAAFFNVASGFCAVGSAASSIAGGGNGDGTGNGSDAGLPEKPTVTCTPGQGLSSPSPTAGCNPGGLGFIPEYTGASGTVPVSADPDPPESLLGQPSIIVEAEVHHTDYAADGTETKRVKRYSVIELDDEQRKLGRIQSIGAIRQGMSDEQGNATAATIDIVLSDEGRPIAIDQGGATTRFSQLDEVKVFARSVAGRAANLPAVPVGRGLLTDETYGSDELSTIEATDELFTAGGAYDPDRKIPQFPYPLSYYTKAPRDLATVPMPVIGGEKSDNGAKNPATGEPLERGKCPARFVGFDGFFGDGWGRMNACLFAIDKIRGLYGSDLGAMGLFGEGLTATVNTDKKTGKVTTTLKLSGGPYDLSAVPTNGYAQIVVFVDIGRFELRIIGKGADTVLVDSKVEQTQINGASWYISRIDYLPRRVKIDLAARGGVDVLVPKWPGWPLAKVFIDFSCADGDFRVTDFAVRGPLLMAHLQGEVTLAFNATGIEEKGDGTGRPIVDFFTFRCWYMQNMVHVQKPKPTVFIGGEWLWPQDASQVPQFEDGISRTNEASFVAAQAATARALGGFGLRIGVWLGYGDATRDVEQAFNDNSSSRDYTDAYGRKSVWLLDPADDPTTWPLITHVSRVLGDIKRRRRHDLLWNVIPGGCDWDPEGDQFKEEFSPPLRDADAIKRNKKKERRSKHYDGRMIANRAHFQAQLQHTLADHKDGPVYVMITGGDLWMLNLRVGQGILLESIAGVGPLGYQRQPMIVTDRELQIDDGVVNLTCLVVYEDLGDIATPIPPRTPFIFTEDADLMSPFTEDDTIAPVMAA